MFLFRLPNFHFRCQVPSRFQQFQHMNFYSAVVRGARTTRTGAGQTLILYAAQHLDIHGCKGQGNPLK